MTNQPDSQSDAELREAIKQIKLKALTKFHNDHADGDIAIYDVVREMTALLDRLNRGEG